MATKYTRKHYEDVVEILKEAYRVTLYRRWYPIAYIQGRFEEAFREDNPHFDLERFRRAATHD